jgi:hypothetical protein
MNTEKSKNRGLFYHRDSGGKHELTPGQYVRWAQQQALKYGVVFDGSPDGIDMMIRAGKSVHGDLFLDYEVCGNLLSRPGLDALIHEASKSNVTHLFIPRRDRLARPENPVEGMELEIRLRKLGVCLVFTSIVCPPVPKGKRFELTELLGSLIDYESAGKFRPDLAEKMILTQIALARAGFSTGGRAPYGFRRWLATGDGEAIRRLADGECVRMPGHHVVWLPEPGDELNVVERILRDLKTMPANQVAAMLTMDGIPPPDVGRRRKVNGVKRLRTQDWYPGTVTAIARNPLLRAIVRYGRRSMGDQRRFDKDNHRELVESDFRDETKVRVVLNAPENCIVAEAKFAPLIDPTEHRKLVEELDRRGGSQRGKPRSRNPFANPLGARVFDLACGWPMYREPYNGSFRYKCGLYQQSHGQKCHHNHVDGLVATRFALSCVRQKLLDLMPRVEERLRELALKETIDKGERVAVDDTSKELSRVRDELQTITINMARALNEDQFRAISSQFDQLKAREFSLSERLKECETKENVDPSKIDIKRITDGFERLLSTSGYNEHPHLACEAIRQANVKLFLKFSPTKVKNRTLNKITSGVITLGDASPPIELYQGPTDRNRVKEPHKPPAVAKHGESFVESESQIVTNREGESLGNVNRADWIRTSDLLTPSQTRYQTALRPE